jgi:hypothetical protein
VAKKKREPVEVPPIFAPVTAAFSKDRLVSCEEGWGSGNVVLKVAFSRPDASERLPDRLWTTSLCSRLGQVASYHLSTKTS